MDQHRLAIVVDGLRLPGGAYVPDQPRGAVVLLHGIPSVALPDADDEGYPGLARRLSERGYLAAWVDMRGARNAPGAFSIEGWVRDARAAINATLSLDGAAGLRLALVGSSAGGAVAAEVVARGAPVDALALLAAPASWVSFAGSPADALTRITEMAGMPVPESALDDPREWAAEFERVTTADAIVKAKVPVLIVHGTDDDVVPVGHAHEIAERAPRAELKVIEGAAHQLRRDERALEILESWLEGVLG